VVHYYIDGYNVLHKSATLRPLMMQDFESAREALIDKVAHFCTATGKEATIVFDGQARHRPEIAPHQRGVRGLHVLYSPHSISADTVIERAVYKAPHRIDLVVVSNDHGLRDLCRNMGALVMQADNFLATVRESRSDIRAALARTRPISPPVLEDHLDADTVARLKALRDKL